MFRFSATVAAGALVAATTLLAFPFLAGAPAFAADIPVTSPDDDGPDTLRQALATANAAAGEDAIIIDPGVGTITLLSALEITDGVRIEGNGTTITRNGSFDMIEIDLGAAGAVEIDSVNFVGDPAVLGRAILAESTAPDDLTITDSSFTGFYTGSELYSLDPADNKEGGAVRVESGQVHVTGSTFENNTSLEGGGAISVGTMTGDSLITLSTFDGNSTAAIDNRGGAVAVAAVSPNATFTVHQSYFVGNISTSTSVTGYRGIALNVGLVQGLFVLDSSTFDHQVNIWPDSKPGPLSGWSVGVDRVADGGSARIVNSTFDEREFGPQTPFYLYVISVGTVDAGAQFTLEHSTVVGGGTLRVENNRGTSLVSNTIAEGLGAVNAIVVLAGTPVTLEYSALSTSLNELYVTDVAGNQFGVDDMMLQPLADNGGPTPTMLIGPVGPAVGTGMPVALASAPTLEQRGAGYLRRSGLLDIGAVELPGDDLPTLPLDPENPATPAGSPTLAETGTDWGTAGLALGSSIALLGGVLVLAGRRSRGGSSAA